MPHTEALAPRPTEIEETAESRPRVASFKTAKGSIYTYDAEGKTTRFKTATSEQEERQDITVFTPMTPELEQEYLAALHLRAVGESKKVYVVERALDDSVRVIRDVSEVGNSDQIYLAITQGGKILKAHQVSLAPVVGYNVFDTRQFEENGQTMTERHLGNKVTEIVYEE